MTFEWAPPGISATVADSTYARVFGVPAPTGVAATDTAAILATVARAVAAGGGIVDFAAGTYHLNAYLPWRSGVKYRGIEPGQQQSVTGGALYASNFLWDWAGTGTVLQGDGTFPAFWDGQTDLGALPGNVDATATKNSGIIGGIGLDNFTIGLQAGAKFAIGLTYSELGRIYIKNCAQAVKLLNFQELFIAAIVDRTPGGQFYGTDITPFVPGNSHFNELYHMLPALAEGFDLRHCKGIVFDARQGDGQNQILVDRIQSTGYNVPLLTVTGTVVVGSANVTVPDGTKFLPGMLVLPPDDAVFVGYTTRTWVVKTVVGNVITLAYNLNAAAFVSSGSGTFTITSTGFANVEVTAAAASYQTALCFNQIDVEGERVGLYLQRALGCEFHIHQVGAATFYGVVARDCGFVVFLSSAPVVTDFDTNTASTCQFFGTRNATKWSVGTGMWWDTVASKSYLSGQYSGPPARIGAGATAAQLEQQMFDIGLTK